eukprot:CAMPEP_0194782714 /NCGR_PEP_ID=MMETSP0323_2-20130528/78838_1 /TAXON_ID=2866 ORGANISM="Crypthecodinium cohnii, Strain Seligo" /NCGR_SAMPLE_ID=MMETSP0323_2 /ASSEMBLY_ACC=CAM_ASM_000346 /LENGTH=112 /DNA_ID=CAMNT_0039721547 /DNA_START=91 /DNA_END=429 /DNA_ORIENTATION=+
MAPMKSMKSMKSNAVPAKSMSKTALAQALADATELKKSQCSAVLNSLAEVVTKEVKKTGKVVLPGISMLKTRVKPATKAGKREIFGKVCMVQAKPAKTVIKAFPVAALKKSI